MFNSNIRNSGSSSPRRRLLLAFIISLVFESEVLAKTQVSKDEPTMLHADKVTVEHELGLVIAKGNVEIFQGETVITCDILTVNRQMNTVTATGNVVMHSPDNEVAFSSYLELSNDLKWGVINEVRILLADDSRLAAAKGEKVGEDEMLLQNGVYSPCNLCKSSPAAPPLWQIKSRTVLWDKQAHEIEYTDAIMEMWGVPVVYTPWLSHPDPSVNRRSGLLRPQFNISKDLGFVVRVPYNYVISEDKDLLLAPLYTSKKGLFLGANYRQRTSKGIFDLGGSIGESDIQVTPTASNPLLPKREKDVTHWHVDGKMWYQFNDKWRMNAHLLRTGEQTYFRQFPYYKYVSNNILTSHMTGEYFYGRNYGRAQVLSFQGLRETDLQSTTPLIAPLIDFHYVSRPREFGHHHFFDFNTMSLYRHNGSKVQRVSSQVGTQLPYVAQYGTIYTLEGSVRGDLYYMDDYISDPTLRQNKKSGAKSRAFPVISLDIRWPFSNSSQLGYGLVEPIVKVIGTPKLSEQGYFPNEDSALWDPREHNLFNTSRLLGLDRIDDGSRIDYGVKFDFTTFNNAHGNIFFGQTHSFQRTNTILSNSGFDQRTSDLLGKVGIEIGEFVDLHYSARFNHNNLNIKRSDTTLSVGKPVFRMNVDFVKIPANLVDEAIQNGQTLAASKQLGLSMSSQFTEFWTFEAATVRDFGLRSGPLSHSTSLNYQDECFGFSTVFSKSFFRDRDLRPDTSVRFILSFKNLGEVSYGGTQKSTN